MMVQLENSGEYNKVLKVQQKKTLLSLQKTLRGANQECHPTYKVFIDIDLGATS